LQNLEFRIDATQPATRELGVTVLITCLKDGNAEFFLPTWTPGSYLLREYSRHLSRVTAVEAGTDRQLPCHKVSKNRVVVELSGAAAIELRYRVYAHELTVRTADVDTTHAYWNHCCLLMWPVDLPDLPATIFIEHPKAWTMSCSLYAENAGTLKPDCVAVALCVKDLAEALDVPVLIGDTQSIEWTVDDVPHSMVLDGLGSIAPPATLQEDLTRIVEQAAAVFGGKLPYDRYVFLSLFADVGYGGLEHRDSSTLLMPRTALTNPSKYRDFLALAAHELFHAWNVKRMRPVEFWNYDYEQENYTKLLWVMEGWTAYFDDLLVARAGLMSPTEYLATMAKNVQNMLAAPGRFALSLEESSFDAWIRLYRPDENTRNSSQNYYGNGAVAALCLDLLIRRKTNGEKSLDTALNDLYRTTFDAGRGYEVADVHAVVESLAGADVVAKLTELVTGALDPELNELLADVGIELTFKGAGKPFLGVAFRANTTTIASVTKDSPAYHAGLAPDDEVLAANNLRVKAGDWQALLTAVGEVDQPMQLLVARRGVINTVAITPTGGTGTATLKLLEDATDAQVAARDAWLHTDSQSE